MNKPVRLTAAAELAAAITEMRATPYAIAWLYLRAAHDLTGKNVTETARRLGMHRRTVQRLLPKKQPKRVSP
jgi:two-component system response regulator RegA